MNIGLGNSMMNRAISIGANQTANGPSPSRSSMADALANGPTRSQSNDEKKPTAEFAAHVEQAKKQNARAGEQTKREPVKKNAPTAKTLGREPAKQRATEEETTSGSTTSALVSPLQPQQPVRQLEARPEVSDETSESGDIEGLDGVDGQDALQAKASRTQNDPWKKAEVKIMSKLRDSQISEKQSAMAEFLTKMKEQFGIDPEQIVQAFAKMDGATLAGSPEEATKAFTSAFKLDAAESKKVAGLYREMVQTTGQADLNEKILDQALTTEAGDDGAELVPEDKALAELGKALEKLDKAFQTNQPATAKLDDRAKAQQAVENMNFQLTRMAQNQDDGADVAPNEAEGDGEDSVEGFTAQFARQQPESQAQSSLETRGEMMKNMANGGKGAESGAGGEAGERSFGQNGKSEFAKALTNEKHVSVAKTDAKVDAKPSLNADATAANGSAQAPLEADLAAGPTLKVVGGPKMSSVDEEANVREMLKQAQVLVKKGGGEVKMDLKPEGVGSVQLKMTVENGQVNVQFITESDSAKRLLEKNMHELKSGLAAHDLKLDALKIDVAQTEQKNSNLDQNRDDQNARQAVQQFAQDVMGQMRDERQGFQQSFMENPGWKQYGRSPNRANMNPENVSQSVAAASKAYSRAQGSTRLNLVA